MSELSENNDQQNSIPTNSNFVDEDKLSKNCNNLPYDDSKCITNLNYSNTNGKDNCKKTPTKTTSVVNYANNNCDNKLIETNISNDLSDLSDTESKYMVAIMHCSTDVDINSQDEKIISNIAKKNMKHIFPSSTEEIEMNTQKFMDLNLLRATVHLQDPQSHLNNSKKHSVEHLESDDSVVITQSSDLPPIIDGFKNFKLNNRGTTTVSEPNNLEKFNKIFFKTNVDLNNQDEDSEIVNFRAMCEAMTSIETIDKQLPHNSNPHLIKKQIKNIILKKVNEDVMNVECVQSTSKLISINSNDLNHINDISKRLACKRHRSNSPTMNLFSNSSPEHFNKLSHNTQLDYQNKKKKISPQNILKMNSKSCSEKIVNRSNSKPISLVVLTSSDDEEDNMLVKNQLSEVISGNKKNKRKRIEVPSNSSEQNKIFIGNEQNIFHCSPNGLIHRDMMNYINQTNCI